jgi:hypothetical protein
MFAALGGSILWALGDLPDGATQAAILIIIFVVVGVIQRLRLVNGRKKDSEDEETTEGESADQGIAGFGSVIKEARAYREDRKRENETRYFGEWITICIAVFAAYIAWMQWRIFVTTNETLLVEQRAWIAPIELETPNNFATYTVSPTRLTFKIQNVGKEPAQKIREKLVATSVATSDLRKEGFIDKTFSEKVGTPNCRTMKVDPKGWTLFSGYPEWIGMDLSADDTKAAIANLPDGPPNSVAIVVGCIVYRTLDTTKFSEVCTMLEPYRKTPGTNDWDWSSTNCGIHNDAE